MQWMVPEGKLDEHQQDILRKCKAGDRPAEWIQGFAGSGKTVLAVHLAQQLHEANPDLRICVAVYTHALKDLIDSGLEERFSREIPVITYHKFLSNRQHYDLVIVDEVQDIGPIDLQRIKSLAGRLVVAGDSDQSIYAQGASPGDINRVLTPRVHKLGVIYRLTKRIIQIVKSILPDSQIEGELTGRMQDVQVTLAKADSTDQEVEWVWRNAKQRARVGDPAAILLPSHGVVRTFIEAICRLEKRPAPDFRPYIPPNGGRGKSTDYHHINDSLRKYGLPLQYTGSSFGSLRDSDTRALTYLMTYHSAKGLDFDSVFLPHLNQSMNFWRDNPDIDRRLFFVGATRSRKNLFLTHTSPFPHPYVQAMPQHLLHKEACAPAATASAAPADDFSF